MKFELTAKMKRGKARTIVWEDGELSGDDELAKAAKAAAGGTFRVAGYGELDADLSQPLRAAQFLRWLLEGDRDVRSVTFSGDEPKPEAVPAGDAA